MPTIPNFYARFGAIHSYHSAVAYLFEAIESSIIHGDDWDEGDYLVQTVRDVLHAHADMLAEHGWGEGNSVTVYRLYTERRDNLATLASRYFDGFTLIQAEGFLAWRG